MNERKPRILVVEDCPDVVRLMTLILKKAGCEVAVAQTGEEGLRRALEESFDVITLDVDLPLMNGFDVCRLVKLQPRLRDTPIVFVSGRALDEDRRYALELGAAGFLAKPFDAQSLVKVVLSKVRENREPCAGARSPSGS
jgi:CheY-like chemotaxis protein